MNICPFHPNYHLGRSLLSEGIRGQESLARPLGPASVLFEVGTLRRYKLQEEDTNGKNDGYIDYVEGCRSYTIRYITSVLSPSAAACGSLGSSALSALAGDFLDCGKFEQIFE